MASCRRRVPVRAGAWSNRFPVLQGLEVIGTALPPGVTVSRVHEYLRDVPYPVTREELIDYARSAHAPDEIVRALDLLPEKRYANPEIVTETLGMI